MTYKAKAAALSALVAVLALVYILALVFDPGNRRSDAFAWLPPDLVVMADGIEISGPDGKISLSRRNNVWVFNGESGELPVRQDRVSDLFALLSKRDVYPPRAASSEARERLGLTEERASRIRVSGGAGLPLLDLLAGGEDVMGREIYLRRSGEDQIYSGDDGFLSFTGGRPVSWYDLRLFPPPGTGDAAAGGNYSLSTAITIESVQEADVAIPGGESYAFRRAGGGWILPGNEGVALETVRVEAWLRTVIEAEGEDFAPAGSAAADLTEGSITLRLGDGSSRTVRLGPADEENRRIASVSDSPFAYVLPGWNVNRLFTGTSYFVKNP